MEFGSLLVLLLATPEVWYGVMSSIPSFLAAWMVNKVKVRPEAYS